jgi:hypothetical protein
MGFAPGHRLAGRSFWEGKPFMKSDRRGRRGLGEALPSAIAATLLLVTVGSSPVARAAPIRFLSSPDSADGVFTTGTPSINAAGTVALGGGGGLYTAGRGQGVFTRVLSSGIVLPNTGVATMFNPKDANVTDGGEVGFVATYTGTGNDADRQGYWVVGGGSGGGGGGVRNVYKVGDPAPGAGAGQNFARAVSVSLNASGAALVHAGTTAGTTTSAPGLWGVAATAGAAPVKIAIASDTAPGLPFPDHFGTLDAFGAPLNGAGQVAFAAANVGVFRGAAGAGAAGLAPVASVFDSLPGLGNLASPENFTAVSMNAAGRVSYAADVSLGTASKVVLSDRGAGGAASVVARAGVAAPGVDVAGVTFQSFTQTWTFDDGRVAFAAQLGGSAVSEGTVGRSGVWAEGADGAMHRVIQTTQAAPGTDGETFQSFSIAGTNGKGQMAIYARTLTAQGIWGYDPIDGLSFIAPIGPITLLDGGTFTPLTVRWATGGYADGGARSMNESGEFVFAADQFRGPGNGVVSAMFEVTVPEPSSAPVVAAALVALASVRGRWRWTIGGRRFRIPACSNSSRTTSSAGPN